MKIKAIVEYTVKYKVEILVDVDEDGEVCEGDLWDAISIADKKELAFLDILNVNYADTNKRIGTY